MSAFCNLCTKDPDTGEYFCVRLGGKWVGECPNFPDGYPWDADRKEDGKWAEVSDRSIAAMVIAPSSTDAKSGATSAHGAANGFAAVNLMKTTSA